MRANLRWSAVGALMILFVAGCSHRVHLQTNPIGARAFVNGDYIGRTPTSFIEKSGFNKTTELRFEKEGYKTREVQVKQAFNPAYVAIAALTFCLPAFLWSMTLMDDYTYTLEPEAE